MTPSHLADATCESARPSLRDHLQQSLSALPNSIPLSLIVLSSSAKRTSTLFPHAAHPPKCLEKEYIVVVSTTVASQTSPVNANSDGTTTDSAAEPSNPSRSLLITALHAYLYTLPQSDTSILYISKVDTSGYATTPLPITRSLITSFLEYHLLPRSRPSSTVQIALFARSQSQYLFPNSAKAPGKRVVGGLKLCGWWKSVYEEVAARIPRKEAHAGGAVQMHYLLPSYSEEEAKGMLGRSKVALPEGVEWNYRPPFSENLFGAASPSEGQEEESSRLAWSIPSLPDDPKTRFLEEIAYEKVPYDHAGPSKIAKNGSNDESNHKQRVEERESQATLVQHDETQGSGTSKGTASSSRSKKDKDKAERKWAQDTLDKTSVDEFWERMGFRQECSSGDVTGFFHLCHRVDPSAITAIGSTDGSAIPPSLKTELTTAIVDRIHSSLLNCDFGSRDLALDGSALWLKSTEAIVKDEIGEEGWKSCIGTVEAKENVPVVGEKRKEEQVTMLQVKKKPKRKA